MGRSENIFSVNASSGTLFTYFNFNKFEFLVIVLSLFFGAAAFLPMSLQGDALSSSLDANRIREAGFLLSGFGLILFTCYRHGGIRIVHKSIFFIIPSLFVFWAILSSPWSNAPSLSAAKAIELCIILSIATLIASVVARRLILLEKFPDLLFLSLSLIIAVYLILNVFLWETPFPLVDYPETGEILYEGARLRFILGYVHPLVTADVLSIAVICLLNSSIKKKYQFLLIIFLSTLLWLTDGRGALAATILAAAVMVFFSIRNYGAKLVLAVMSGGLVPLLFVIDFVSLGISVWGSDTLSLNGRVGLWSSIFEIFSRKPITGYGYFSTRNLMLAEFPWAGHAHNTFFEILLTTGIVGGILFVIFTAGLVYLLFKTGDKLLWGVSIYCYIAGFLNPLLFVPSFPMFILMLCILRAYICLTYKRAFSGRLKTFRKIPTAENSRGFAFFPLYSK